MKQAYSIWFLNKFNCKKIIVYQHSKFKSSLMIYVDTVH